MKMSASWQIDYGLPCMPPLTYFLIYAAICNKAGTSTTHLVSCAPWGGVCPPKFHEGRYAHSLLNVVWRHTSFAHRGRQRKVDSITASHLRMKIN